MSNYLLNVQRAIAQTEKFFAPSGGEYQSGWEEVAIDLSYGISCGSEAAVECLMQAWSVIEPNNPYFEELDSDSDKGYCDRVKAIQLLMEKCDDC